MLRSSVLFCLLFLGLPLPVQAEAPNIVFITVDVSNGAPLPAESPGGIHEAFISGTQPGASSFANLQ